MKGCAFVITRFCWSHNLRAGVKLFWKPRVKMQTFRLPAHRERFPQDYSGGYFKMGIFEEVAETAEPVFRGRPFFRRWGA